MALSEKLQFLLTVDARGAVKGFEQVGKAADKSLGRAEDRLDKLGGNMQKAGAAAMAFAGVAAGGLKKLADSASDLGEAVSKAGEIFGPNAKEIEKFGKTAAKSFGLSKREAVDAASRFGIFGRAAKLTGSELVNFSTDLTALAADMGSFNNVETAEVLDAIASALAGQSRPLQRFGVLLDQATLKARALEMGIYDGTGMLTGQQKVLAAHAEILAQTTVQAGDFSRTLGESLPNQAKVFSAELENLKAGIGEGVLPMFLGVTKAASGVVGAFNGMSDSSKKTVGQFAALGTAAIGTLGALSFIGGTLIKMRRNFTDAAGGLNAMGKAAKGLGVAIGVATAALIVYSAQQAKNARESAQFVKGIDDIGRAADDALARTFVDAMKLGMLAGKDFNGVLDEVTQSSIGSAQRLLDLERATGAVSAGLRDGNVAAKSSAEVIAELEAAVIAETEAQKQAIVTQQMSTAAIEDGTDATEDATGAESDRAGKIADVVSALDRQRQAQDDARSSLDELHGATIASIDSSLGYRNQTARTQKAIEDANKVINDGQSSLEDIAGAYRDAEGAALDQASAAVRMAKDQAAANKQTLTAKQETDIYRAELIKLRDTLQGDARAAIQGHIDKLDAIPDKVSTQVIADVGGASRALDGLIGKLDAIGARSTTRAVVSAARFRERATGGIVGSGETTLVGERGPELVSLPAGSKVHTNQQSKGMLSSGAGSPVYLTVNAGLGTDGRDVGRLIVEELQKYQRRNGPGSLP